MKIVSRKTALVRSAAVMSLMIATPVLAQLRTFDVPAQSATKAIPEFARQAGIQIIAAGSRLRGKTTTAIKGDLDVRAALRLLLSGTGLRIASDDGAIITLARDQRSQDEKAQQVAAEEAGAGGVAAESRNPDIVVTGSHIRGAQPTSPVISITAEDMSRAGQNDLGEAMRSLPQNFSGGQNPGVGSGGEGYGNQNVVGSSQPNLRGLGASATLTLLNGRRLPYDSATQGVDISSIPSAAVERIEILTDGASALYGSDAVGGVVNVILKRSYDGLTTSARVAGATDGGDLEQQYDAVAGHSWGSGSLMVSGEYSHSTAIRAHQRDLTSGLYPSATIYPEQKYYGSVLTGHQDIGDAITVSLDASYGKRTSVAQLPLSTTSDYLGYGSLSNTDIKTVYISPGLDIRLPHRWKAGLYMTYGRDTSYLDASVFLSGSLYAKRLFKYRNTTTSYEANADGPLFSLPAGDVKLAIGAGYRENDFKFLGTPRYSGSQGVFYGFAEVHTPLISPSEDIHWVNQLAITAAGRIESYNGSVGDVFTPKLGILYAPTRDFDLKASWGRSFKAPTLFQRHSVTNATLAYASSTGGTGYPSGSTIIELTGGNPDLKPERAESLSATLSIHPVRLAGFKMDVTYFDTIYKDRVSAVIPNSLSYLGDTAYEILRTRNPTLAQVADAIASTTTGLISNTTKSAFDPSTVVAIVDNRYRNVSTQHIHGVDISGSYHFELPRGSLTASGDLAYLDTKQSLIAGSAYKQVSGRIFRSPEFRGRAGLSWDDGPLVVSSYVNYIDGVDDDRYTPALRINGMTTADLTLGYAFAGNGIFKGLQAQLSIVNLFDAMPKGIETTSCNYCTPYDSANYSIVGRVVGLTVTKAW